MWDLQAWYAEWETSGRYVGLTGVVCRMGEEWEICGTYRRGMQNGRRVGDMWDFQAWYAEWETSGRYVGPTGVAYRKGDEWEICGMYRGSMNNCHTQNKAILKSSDSHALHVFLFL